MYLVNESWFSSLIGDIIIIDEDNVKFYSCNNEEDVKKIAEEVTIPSYEFMREKSIAWYRNYQTAFFYLMKFGEDADKLCYRRTQDVFIGAPDKKSMAFFLESFYPLLWQYTFGDFTLSDNINDYKVVDSSTTSAFNFYGNYYYL
ncbi:hypothetical protein OZX61_02140 [Acinetobacter sp. ESL0695]|uniref:hypothetical protein n=1 Tax=Acinetobacter sp. ESL0695 TaxID=2983215 RepID=UPI0023F45584|nr:hypothetical protein [Acinetobacter sp. ESL0695]WEV49309.1 hypothetical protein OZX61_02140 [Acinetobacter sp. ESL0695]